MTLGTLWGFNAQLRRKFKMLLVTGQDMDNLFVLLCFKIIADTIGRTYREFFCSTSFSHNRSIQAEEPRVTLFREFLCFCEFGESDLQVPLNKVCDYFDSRSYSSVVFPILFLPIYTCMNYCKIPRYILIQIIWNPKLAFSNVHASNIKIKYLEIQQCALTLLGS